MKMTDGEHILPHKLAMKHIFWLIWKVDDAKMFFVIVARVMYECNKSHYNYIIPMFFILITRCFLWIMNDLWRRIKD